MTPRIRALSLWQPWASLMAWGFKLHETRHWATRVRGRVAIHAANVLDEEGAPQKLSEFAFGPVLRDRLPLGAVVAVGYLDDCRPTEEVVGSIDQCDWLAGNYEFGRFAFRFNNIQPLVSPITAKGHQGFWWWTPPDDLEARLLPPVDHAEIVRKWEARA